MLQWILKTLESVIREPDPSESKFRDRLGNEGRRLNPIVGASAPRIGDGSGNGSVKRKRIFSLGGGTASASGSAGNSGGGSSTGGRRRHDGFTIVHFAGTVAYTTSGWLTKNTDYLPDRAADAMMATTSPVLQRVVGESRQFGGAQSK